MSGRAAAGRPLPGSSAESRRGSGSTGAGRASSRSTASSTGLPFPTASTKAPPHPARSRARLRAGSGASTSSTRPHWPRWLSSASSCTPSSPPSIATSSTSTSTSPGASRRSAPPARATTCSPAVRSRSETGTRRRAPPGPRTATPSRSSDRTRTGSRNTAGTRASTRPAVPLCNAPALDSTCTSPPISDTTRTASSVQPPARTTPSKAGTTSTRNSPASATTAPTSDDTIHQTAKAGAALRPRGGGGRRARDLSAAERPVRSWFFRISRQRSVSARGALRRRDPPLPRRQIQRHHHAGGGEVLVALPPPRRIRVDPPAVVLVLEAHDLPDELVPPIVLGAVGRLHLRRPVRGHALREHRVVIVETRLVLRARVVVERVVRADPVVGGLDARVVLVDAGEQQARQPRGRHAAVRPGPTVRAVARHVREAPVVRGPALVVALAPVLAPTDELERLPPDGAVRVVRGDPQGLQRHVGVREVRPLVAAVADASVVGVRRLVTLALVGLVAREELLALADRLRVLLVPRRLQGNERGRGVVRRVLLALGDRAVLLRVLQDEGDRPRDERAVGLGVVTIALEEGAQRDRRHADRLGPRAVLGLVRAQVVDPRVHGVLRLVAELGVELGGFRPDGNRRERQDGREECERTVGHPLLQRSGSTRSACRSRSPRVSQPAVSTVAAGYAKRSDATGDRT